MDVHAMVLSGSGCSSTAAFEVGVMKALMEEEPAHLDGIPLDPAIYSGSEFGAFNAAIMASQAGSDTASTLRYLERVWLDDISSTSRSCGNGVYRLRGNPFVFLNPRCYVPQPAKPFIETFKDLCFLSTSFLEQLQSCLGDETAGPLWQRLLQFPTLTPFFDMRPLESLLRKHVDLERLRRSDKELIVMASDWARGMPCAFSKHEMTDDKGHAILRASMAFLLVFPFVEIDGRAFGGAPGTMATPLRPVIDTYAARNRRLTIHVVFVETAMENIPLGVRDSAFGGLGRTFSLNESVNIRAEVEYHPGQAGVVSPGAGTLSLVQASGQDIADLGSLTIHWYRPSKPIVNWFELTDFDRKKAEGYIAQGYGDALRHDCQAAGCILAA
jgi:predicted acylesterase/phospholipase RssA